MPKFSVGARVIHTSTEQEGRVVGVTADNYIVEFPDGNKIVEEVSLEYAPEF